MFWSDKLRILGPVVFLILIVVASNAWAEEPPPTLAKFSMGEDSPQNHIEFPDVEGDVSAAVHCYASIMGSGGIRRTICFESLSVDQKFNDAVQDGMKHAKATGASVNGKKYSVGIYFRVVFVRLNGESFIGVYPNWGNDVDKYDLDYRAPQRYSTAILPRNCRNAWGNIFALATMRIGTDGAVKGDVTLDFNALNSDEERCGSSIETLHKGSEYIPGEYEGEPVEATYLEGWGNFEVMIVE